MALINLIAAICLQLPQADGTSTGAQDLLVRFTPTKMVMLTLDTLTSPALNFENTAAMVPMPDSPSKQPRLLEPWDTSKAPPVKLLEPWNVAEAPPVMLIAD